MKLRVSGADPAGQELDALIIPLARSETLPRGLRGLDAALGGAITRSLERGDFAGNSNELSALLGGEQAAKRIILIGLGDQKEVSEQTLRAATATAVREAARRKSRSAGLLVPPLRRIATPNAGQALTEGALLGSYRFDKYRTTEDKPTALESLELFMPDAARARALRQGIAIGTITAEAENLARDLSNEPGSVHTPTWLGERAREIGREFGLRVHVLGARELEAQKLGGLLAVGRGSANPPRLIVLEHGARPKASARRGRKATGRSPRGRPTIALVGKGITFDTGGVSLKPSASMEDMKHDMSGGAAVLGCMRAIALLKLPLHVVGIVPAAENKQGANAYLPGDVIETAAGKTIEVINTDAEGRIVLSDAIHYATRYEPDAIIDLATLTGACVVALGSAAAGLMGNDDVLIERVRAAGERAHERAWPLPLWKEHREQIKSHIADIKNTGGREAGTLTAAAFLSHFAGEIPWAHLDIAGTAWTGRDQALCVKGATGFGVRLLVELLRNWR